MTKPRSLRRLTIFLVLGATLGLGACEDLLTETPPHIIVADNLYVDLVGFEAGLSALYASARGEHESWTGSSSVRMTMWNAGTDQVFIPSAGTGYRPFNFWLAEAEPAAPPYLALWSWLYQAVNGANTIIARAENPNVQWTQAQKNLVIGEARFFRAWAYRHLANSFGAVPLNLEESSGGSVRTDWERTPVADVRKQIEQDLLFAEQHLPTTTSSPGRVTKGVAQHYLAELYLTTGENAKAEEKAKALINGGTYRLITQRYGVRAGQAGVPFMDQFYDGNVNRSQGNTEALWLFQFQKDVAGAGEPIMRRSWLPPYESYPGMMNSLENGGRGVHRLAPTRWALNIYEPQDHRASIHAIRWYLRMNNPATLPAGRQLGDTIFQSRTTPERFAAMRDWPWPRKWEWADPLNVIGNNDFMNHPKLRLAETYLVLAEAQFKQGKTGDAAQTLNVIRQRSNATPVDAGQVTLDFILDEYARELLAEGERRYILLRNGKWLERTRRHNPIAGPNIRDHNVLFPIPQAVIDANLGAVMEQNPGY